MISAIEWVPAGVADPNPKKYEFSQAEVELIEMMENQNLDDMKAELQAEHEESQKKKEKKKTKLPKIENNLPADLRMDEYSSDEDENDAVQGTAIGRLLVEDNEVMEEEDNVESAKNEDMDSDDESDDDDDLEDVPDTREYSGIDVDGLNSLGLAQAGTNAPVYMDGEEDDDGSEQEDVRIQPGDAIAVVAKTEDDFASLEVHVYEQTTGNLFVHHDIPLPSFPLCLAQGDISPAGGAGNFCAVGTFSPGIEVWNLDVLNALEPSCILGGEDTSMADEIMKMNMASAGSKKKILSQGNQLRHGSHTDAVMALSWNKVHRQVVASGSADCTVKLWDVTQAGSDQCNAATMSHHKDKVQSVVWHPKEGTLLATGSYDRTVALADARSTDNVKRVKIPADCETLTWDPFNPEYLTAACEDGSIMCWDVRKFSTKTPLWSIVANEYGGVSDISYNPNVPGLLASCSVDKTVTLWDTYNKADDNYLGPPQACGNKEMNVGKLYTLNFYPSSPWLLGCGGGGKEIALWDMTREMAVQKRFGIRSIGTNVTIPEQEGAEETSTKPKEDFQSMISGPTTATSEATKASEVIKKKKTGGKKKKKKAHRAGR